MNLFRIFSDFKRLRSPAKSAHQTMAMPCPICNAEAKYLDTVDFNKACTVAEGIERPPAGIPIDYLLCDSCGFCFAPEMAAWQMDDFVKFIYNDDYASVDPGYQSGRPLANAAELDKTFGVNKKKIRHLDYGGGSGALSKALREKGWNSTSYDPIIDRDKDIESLGTFNLVTAYEVFSNVPDSVQLVQRLKKLCETKGLILFSTLLSDGNIDRTKKLDWWYAAPRNGHVNLYSRKSLAELIQRNGLDGIDFSDLSHAVFVNVPDWAGHIIRRS